MPMKAPAKVTGSIQSFSQMASCGPTIADTMPPARIQEIALPLKKLGDASAAAKRIFWVNPPDRPINSRPKAKSQKSVRKSARAATVPPIAPISAPTMKLSRRPRKRDAAATTTAPIATPILKPVRGAVARDLSAPSSWKPARPPTAKLKGPAEPRIAWAAVRIYTLRLAERSWPSKPCVSAAPMS